MGSILGVGVAPEGASPYGTSQYVSTALESGTFKWGGVTFPVAVGAGTALLEADPALYYLLDYWATVLETHLGARYSAAVTAGGRSDIATDIVKGRVPFDPLPYMTQDQLKFPLLAVWRRSGVARDQSATVLERSDTDLGVLYALPPLTAGQAEAIMPILHQVPHVLTARTTEAHDPSWQSDQRVTALGGMQEVGVRSWTFGNIPSIKGDLWFPSVALTVRLKERWDLPADAFDRMAGADIDIDHTDADGTTVWPGFVEVKEEVG